jgi:3-(3-hydroxy-phenyl)propionate hydroxylase
VDPVIIVGAGPVGLTLALALARQEVPSVVLDEGPGKDEQRLARTVVLREDTVALVERLTGLPLDDAGFRWAGWRSMRRRQVMREIAFDGKAPGSTKGVADPLGAETAWGAAPPG